MAKKQNQDNKLDLEGLDFQNALEIEDSESIPDEMKLSVDDDDSTEETEQESTEEPSSDDQKKETEEETDPNSTEEEETGEESEDEGELTLVDEIKTMLGFDTEDEFDDTPEGLIELVKSSAGKMAEAEMNALFEQLPDVREYMRYRLQGGEAAAFFKTFFGQTDFSSLNIDEEDVAMQEHVVRRALELQGFEPTDVAETISEMKNSGTIFSQAQRFRKVLSKHQEQEKSALLMQQERESMAFKEQQAKVVEEIAKTIKSSKEVRGIPISEKEKSELIDFITNGPEGSELSHFQLALQDAPTDVHIAIAALVKRNFNLDGIIARRASTKNAEGLRSRLQSVKERVPSKGSKRSKEVVEKPDFNELDISLI